MPITPDPTSPIGKKIPLLKSDVDRLRSEGNDQSVAAKAYDLDPGFRKAADAYFAADLDETTRNDLPRLLLNRYYNGTWEDATEDILTTNIAQSSLEMSKPSSVTVAGQFNPLVKAAGFAGETISNIPSSAVQFGQDIAGVITNPIQTIKALGQAGLGGLANLAETLTGNEELFDLESEQVASAIGDFYTERYGGIDRAAETLKNDPVGFVADFAGFLSGAGLGLRGVGTAGKVARVARAGETAAQVAVTIDPLLATTRAVGKGLSKVTPSAERVMSSALKLKPTVVKKIRKKSVAGKSPSKWLLERGIAGNIDQIVDQLDDLTKSSKSAVDNGLAAIKQTFENERVGQAIDVLSDALTGTVGNEDIISRLVQLRKKGALDLSEINEVKRMIDANLQIFKSTGDVKTSATAKGLANIRDEIKTFIEDTAAENGFKDVKPLNKQTQVSREILNAITDTLDTASRNRIFSLTDFLVGTAGGAAGGPLGAGGAVLFKKIVETPAFMTRMAKLIDNLPTSELSILDQLIKTKRLTPESESLIRRIMDESIKAVPLVEPVRTLESDENMP